MFTIPTPTTKKLQERLERLAPLTSTGRVPRYIRVYDNGGDSIDRYTVVFTSTKDGICHYVGMSSDPYWPQGVGTHGESQDGMIDRPGYSHLGKKSSFAALPPDCQDLVLRDYAELWSLTD